jgi:hypothetical protein
MSSGLLLTFGGLAQCGFIARPDIKPLSKIYRTTLPLFCL